MPEHKLTICMGRACVMGKYGWWLGQALAFLEYVVVVQDDTNEKCSAHAPSGAEFSLARLFGDHKVPS